VRGFQAVFYLQGSKGDYIQIRVVFLLCMMTAVIASVFSTASARERLLLIGEVNFKTSPSCNVWTVIVAIILVVLYVVFW